MIKSCRLISFSRVVLAGYCSLGLAAFNIGQAKLVHGAAFPGNVDLQGAQVQEVHYLEYLPLLSSGRQSGQVILARIERDWHPSSPVMLVEVARFCRDRDVVNEIYALLERKTGQPFGNDYKKWFRWIWAKEYQPHADYANFKSALYSRIDDRFSEYFAHTKNAKIRLDEIRWGGVLRDGIPPLKNPKMIPAGEATFLDDSNVVFGVSLNGDARCYPKRILAWHEMFKDTIGGESVCGAY